MPAIVNIKWFLIVKDNCLSFIFTSSHSLVSLPVSEMKTKPISSAQDTTYFKVYVVTEKQYTLYLYMVYNLDNHHGFSRNYD